MKLDELFTVKNGIASSGLIIEPLKYPYHIPYLRPASTQQRTLAGWIWECDIDSKNIYPAETLFVSTNGEGSHSYAYVSSFEFVPNSDISVLIPKKEMTILEKIYYAMCITKNRFRFSYGRKPKGNRLKSLELPDKMPNEFNTVDIKEIKANLKEIKRVLTIENSQNIKPIPPNIKLAPIKDLFTIKYGNSLELVRLDKCKKTDCNAINFVSRTEKNNGVSAIVEKIISENPNPEHTLSVAGGGSVLATFYQSEEYYSGRDIYCLIPKKEYSQLEMLYYAMCIRKNKYRYSYGRQANKTLKDILIPEKMPDEFNVIDMEKLHSLLLKHSKF